MSLQWDMNQEESRTTSEGENPEPTKSDFEKNLEILGAESMSLASVYKAAVAYDPRLSDVNIVPVTENENNENQKPFFARKPWNTESGKGEVHILVGDSKKIGQLALNTINENPEFEELIRRLLYVRNDQGISIQEARALVFLHELGHVSDFYDHAADPRAYEESLRVSKGSLPLGYVSSAKIKEVYNSDTEFRELVEKNFGTLDNAMAQYRKLRHSLPSEKKADEFASKILQRNATVLVALANNLFKS